jgi:hypothetical protein
VGPSEPAHRSGERDDEDGVMSEVDKGAMHAVHTAIACNVAILAAKMSVFAVSGSSSILAEVRVARHPRDSHLAHLSRRARFPP